jgi:hypothetical protein
VRAGSHWIAFCNEDCLLFSAEQAHSRYVSCQVRPFSASQTDARRPSRAQRGLTSEAGVLVDEPSRVVALKRDTLSAVQLENPSRHVV